jgi:hypothetical protein
MSTITTINATDTIASSRGVINTNFTNLNNDKVESTGTITDDRLVRYDGTTGALVQSSDITVTDAGEMSGVTRLDVDNIRTDGNVISSTNTDGNIVLTPNGTGIVTTAATATVRSGASATAGGAIAMRIGTGANGVVGIFFGSGVPTISAPQGSLYLRTDGSSVSTRMYVNTNGSTTWTNVTTAA